MCTDEQDQQGRFAAELIAADGSAGDHVGEGEVGGDGAKFEHGGFSECHGNLSSITDGWGINDGMGSCSSTHAQGTSLKQRGLSAGHDQAEVLVGQARGYTAARR